MLFRSREGSATLRFSGAEGRPHFELYSFTTVYDGAHDPHDPVGAIISIRDISDEMEQEAEYQRLRLLLQNFDIAIFDYDVVADTLYFHTNGATQGLLDLTIPDYYAYVKTDPRIAPQGREAILEMLDLASKNAISGNLEYFADNWGNGWQKSLMEYTSVADNQGQVYRIVGYIKDLVGTAN